MKRFTETTKWRDPWFRRLSPIAKHLWNYLNDNCDCVGFIHLDLEAASFDVGARVKKEHLTELVDRTQDLGNGKIFIPTFIPFQYGTVSQSCAAHKPVLKLISQYQLTTNLIGYQYPINTLAEGIQIPQGKGKEKEEEKEGGMQGGIYSPESRVALHWLNDKSGKHFRECESSLAPINARLKEPDVEIEGVKKMITRQCQLWKGSNMEEYLRPQTLFGKEKFDAYYAAKDQPIKNGNSQTTKPNPRNIGVAKFGISYGEAAKRLQEKQNLALQMAETQNQ